MSKQSAVTFIHEINPTGHRIVRVKDGVAAAGAWKPQHLTAEFDGGYYANLDTDSGLPFGVFKASSVPHEVLS